MGRLGKILLEIFGALVCVVVILAIGFIWRLSNGPISLDFARSYLEDALLPKNTALDPRLGEPILTWEGWNRAFDIAFNGLEFNLPNKSVRLTSERLIVRLSTSALIEGLITPKRLKLESANINITTKENSKEKQDALAILADFQDKLIPSFLNGMDLSYLETVELSKSTIEISNIETSPSIKLGDVNASLVKDAENWDLKLNAKTGVKSKTSKIELNLTYHTKSREIKVTTQLISFPFEKVAENTMQIFHGVKINTPVDIELNFTANLMDGNSSLNGSLTAFNGKIHAAKVYQREINFNKLTTQFAFNDLSLPVAKGKATIANNEVSVSTEFKWQPETKEYFIELEALSEEIELETLKKYVPSKILSQDKVLFFNHLANGTLRNTNIKVLASTNEGILNNWDIKKISGHANFNELQVKLPPPMAPIQELSGSFRIETNAFWATATEGSIDGISLKGSKIIVKFDDILAPHASMNLVATGKVQSILKQLKHPEFGLKTEINSIPEGLVGIGQLNVNLQFPLGNNIGSKRLIYSGNANLSDVIFPNFLLGKKLSRAQITLTATPTELHFSGSGSFNGKPVVFNQTNFLTPDSTKTRHQKLTLILNSSDLGVFDNSLPITAHGSVPIDIEITRFSTGITEVAGILDLQDTTLVISRLNWTKPSGAAGRLRFQAELDKGTLVRLKNINLAAADLSLNATASFSRSNKKLIRADIEKLLIADSKIKGTISLKENGLYHGNFSGSKLNISKLIGSRLPTKTGEGDFSIDANFEEVYVWDLPPIKNTNLKIKNYHPFNSRIELTGRVGDEPVIIQSWERDGIRQFNLKSNHAGRVLKGFDIVDSITGGWLNIDGEITGTGKAEVTKTDVSIIKFGLKDAPLFTQVLNAASLVGLLDTLRGKGIQFQKLNAEVIFTENKIEIIDSFAFGASLGLSATGEIARDTDETSVKGMIVPAYGLNRLIDQIPILGRILTGGEKEGLLAAEYLISDTRDQPTVTVNPLTALTPGFLRAFVRATRKPIK